MVIPPDDIELPATPELALKVARQGVYDLNIQTGEAVVSDEYAEMLGYEPSTFVESNAAWLDRLHPDDLEVTRQAYLDHAEGRSRTYHAEFRQRANDGSWKWILSLGHIVSWSPDGQALRMVGTHTDISAQKAAEARLRKSEAAYRSLFDRMLDGFATHEILCDEAGTPVDYRFLSVNPAFEALTGLRAQDIVGRTYRDVFPREKPNWVERYGRVALTGVPIEFEDYSSGLKRHFSVRAYQPQLGQFATLFLDITGRKQAERDLKVAHDAYYSLLSTTLDGFLLVDNRGRIRDANARYEAMSGYTRAELLELSILDLSVSPTQQDLVATIDRLMVEGGVSLELRHRRKDGTLWRTELSATIRKDDVTLFQVFIRDITARVEAQAAIALQAAALGASVDGIVITDSAGVVDWVNPAMEALTGYAEQELVGQSIEILKSREQPDAFHEAFWNTIRSGRSWTGEFINRRKDGSLYTEANTVAPVLDRDGAITHYVAIKRDMTEQKRINAEFLHAQKMEVVGRLTGSIAHDFNNLIGVMNGTADLMALSVPAADRLRADLETIRHAGEQAAVLTRQLLAFSRKEVLDLRVVDLNRAVKNTTRMLARLVGENVQLTTELEASHPTVLADLGQMEQLLLNLVVNARDAMPSGGAIVIRTADVPDGVRLSVSDTGSGIDPANRDRIFEPFFTTKDATKGTGLGLSTVRRIVTTNGGRIEFESEPHKGTTFVIVWPRSEELAVPSAQPVPPHRATVGSATILLVEDDPPLMRITERMLQTAGYRVLAADSAEEAMRIIQSAPGRIDLLLTDVVLPAMSGPQLAKHAVARCSGLKVIYVSGYPDDVLDKVDREAIGNRLIRKPYSASVLLDRVREALT